MKQTALKNPLQELPEKFVIRYDIFPFCKLPPSYNYDALFKVEYPPHFSYNIFVYFHHIPKKLTYQWLKQNYGSCNKTFQGVINQNCPHACEIDELYIVKEYAPHFQTPYIKEAEQNYGAQGSISDLIKISGKSMDPRLFYFISCFYNFIIKQDAVKSLFSPIPEFPIAFSKPNYALLNIPIYVKSTTQADIKLCFESIKSSINQKASSYLYYSHSPKQDPTAFIFLKKQKVEKFYRLLSLRRNILQIIPYEYFDFKIIRENSFLIGKNIDLIQMFHNPNIICILNEGAKYRLVHAKGKKENVIEFLQYMRVTVEDQSPFSDIYKVFVNLPTEIEPLDVFQLFETYSAVSIQQYQQEGFLLYVSGKENCRRVLNDFPDIVSSKIISTKLVIEKQASQISRRALNSYSSAHQPQPQISPVQISKTFH